MILFLAACGGDVKLKGDTASNTTLSASCSDGSPVDTYVARLMHASDGGTYEVVMAEANPAPPDVGINSFNLEIDGATGAAVTPWMPLHGHGTVPATFTAVDNGDGSWSTGDMDLFMPGLWELQVTISGSAEDTALFRFCLEG